MDQSPIVKFVGDWLGLVVAFPVDAVENWLGLAIAVPIVKFVGDWLGLPQQFQSSNLWANCLGLLKHFQSMSWLIDLGLL